MCPTYRDTFDWTPRMWVEDAFVLLLVIDLNFIYLLTFLFVMNVNFVHLEIIYTCSR